MYTKWTSHLEDPAAKKRFESSIQGSKTVLDRLKTIIEEEEKAIEQSEMDAKAYDNPSWAYKQAFKNGTKAAYRSMKKLVNLDEQVITVNE